MNLRDMRAVSSAWASRISHSSRFTLHDRYITLRSQHIPSTPGNLRETQITRIKIKLRLNLRLRVKLRILIRLKTRQQKIHRMCRAAQPPPLDPADGPCMKNYTRRGLLPPHIEADHLARHPTDLSNFGTGKSSIFPGPGDGADKRELREISFALTADENRRANDEDPVASGVCLDCIYITGGIEDGAG
ncbi:hypothetical protein BBP40_001406 [Aspergillus hancockii]|nr:hypothetical protein BBP40_001406 [Aspergillus hancockii]